MTVAFSSEGPLPPPIGSTGSEESLIPPNIKKSASAAEEALKSIQKHDSLLGGDSARPQQMSRPLRLDSRQVGEEQE